MTPETGYILFLTAIAIFAGASANTARKQQDVASTVMYSVLWLGMVLAISLR